MVDPFPREIIQPALSIVQVPERDPVDDIGVLAEQPEELAVLIRLSAQHLRRAMLAIWIEPRQLVAMLAAVRPPAPARDYVDVQLGNDDFEPEFTHRDERFLDIGKRDAINLVVPLQADCVDRGFAFEFSFVNILPPGDGFWTGQSPDFLFASMTGAGAIRALEKNAIPERFVAGTDST
jgi:hypothetical protein